MSEKRLLVWCSVTVVVWLFSFAVAKLLPYYLFYQYIVSMRDRINIKVSTSTVNKYNQPSILIVGVVLKYSLDKNTSSLKVIHIKYT